MKLKSLLFFSFLFFSFLFFFACSIRSNNIVRPYRRDPNLFFFAYVGRKKPPESPFVYYMGVGKGIKMNAPLFTCKFEWWGKKRNIVANLILFYRLKRKKKRKKEIKKVVNRNNALYAHIEGREFPSHFFLFSGTPANCFFK